MRTKILAIAFLSLIGIHVSVAQPKPYVRPNTVIKPANVGIYPNIKKATNWIGREPGLYSIKFKVKGLKPGDTVFLADYHLDGKYYRDTAYVDKNLVAHFSGDLKFQRGMYLFVFPKAKDYFEFIMDDDQEFMITTDTAYWTRDFYFHMTVDGSEQNQAFVNYQTGKVKIVQDIINIDNRLKQKISEDSVAIYKAQRTKLMTKKNNFDSVYIQKNPNHLLSRFLYAIEDVEIPTELPTLADGTKDSAYPYVFYKNHYWDRVDFNEDGLVRMPVNIIKQKLDFYFDKVILQDPDSCIQASSMLLSKSKNSVEMERYLIWYLTNRFETSNIMGLDKAFVYMAMTTYCNGKAWWVDSTTVASMCESAYRRRWTLIGEQAPALELQDKDGKWINTNSFQSPYTILIFWDPTCGHCREVMPKLATIQKNNADKNWKVIALYPSDKKKEWTDYMAEHPEMESFTHLMRGEVRNQAWADNLSKYYVIASPTIFLLDANKKILANRIDVEKIEDFIKFIDSTKNTAKK